MLTQRFENVLTRRWSRVGTANATVADRLMARVRTLRPTTRLWFDTLMPITVLAVASGGSPPLRATILVVLTANFIHGAATIVNDLNDIEVDRRSVEIMRSTRPIALGVIARKQALRESVA